MNKNAHERFLSCLYNIFHMHIYTISFNTLKSEIHNKSLDGSIPRAAASLCKHCIILSARSQLDKEIHFNFVKNKKKIKCYIPISSSD